MGATEWMALGLLLLLPAAAADSEAAMASAGRIQRRSGEEDALNAAAIARDCMHALIARDGSGGGLHNCNLMGKRRRRLDSDSSEEEISRSAFWTFHADTRAGGLALTVQTLRLSPQLRQGFLSPISVAT